MKNRIIYVVMAAAVIGLLPTMSAQADDAPYYKLLSTQCVIPTRTDNVPMERALSFPIVVERTSEMSVMINGAATPVLLEETTALPVQLERTSVAKPHHWPLSFGVWP